MKIILAGGGTGGHLFPIIAVTREINKLYAKSIDPSKKKKGLKLIYTGPKGALGLELTRALAQDQIKIKKIIAGKIRRYGGVKAKIQNFFDIFKTIIGIVHAFFFLFFSFPDAIFSKGGYGSVPIVVAGSILRIPIFVHESDIVPGLANKILNKRAAQVFVSFPGTENFDPSNMTLTGNPIRKELMGGSPDNGKRLFNLKSEKPVALIIGGSQGAERVNSLILDALPGLLKNFEIIHQTGKKNFKQVASESKVMIEERMEKYYHPIPFLNEQELKLAYAVSDIIVSRAGSGSIFEIAAIGRPSILIPLPESAQDHQAKNAYSYARKRATVVLEEENTTPNFFLQTLKNIVGEPEDMEIMKKAARDFSKPEAATEIAKYIIKYLNQ